MKRLKSAFWKLDRQPDEALQLAQTKFAYSTLQEHLFDNGRIERGILYWLNRYRSDQVSKSWLIKICFTHVHSLQQPSKDEPHQQLVAYSIAKSNNTCRIRLNILVPFDPDSVTTEFSIMELTLSFNVSFALLEPAEDGYTFCTQSVVSCTQGKHSVVIPLPLACLCTCARDNINVSWVGDVLEIRYSVPQKCILTPAKKNKV